VLNPDLGVGNDTFEDGKPKIEDATSPKRPESEKKKSLKLKRKSIVSSEVQSPTGGRHTMKLKNFKHLDESVHEVSDSRSGLLSPITAVTEISMLSSD
jgi:hypothetical protein